MKINNSSINMSSKSSKTQYYKKEESLKINNEESKISDSNDDLDILELSDEGTKKLENLNELNHKDKDSFEYKLSEKDKSTIRLIEQFVETNTGKKIKIKIFDELELSSDDEHIKKLKPIENPTSIEYTLKEEYYESQKMEFSSNGTVTTSEGKEINFNININMSSEFYSNTDVNISKGKKLVDPLVINFEKLSTNLSEQKFEFDIDKNGESDQISNLKKGSGFLALDKNNDGIINDGGELFGTSSGDGFDDLSVYDSDGNNWIDENDEIFDKLRIWVKDDEGNNRLFAIGEKGIGAIFLGNIDTNFEYKDSKNDTDGELQKTGIFLKENGDVGTIQHIDFSI